MSVLTLNFWQKQNRLISIATLESALKEQIRLKEQAQWLKENSDAMEAYNQFVERNGTFSDSVRKF